MALAASGYVLESWRAAIPWRQARRVLGPLLIGVVVAINLLWSLNFNPYAVFPAPKVPSFYQELGQRPGKGAVLDIPISFYWFPHYGYFQFWHKRPNVSSTLFHDAMTVDAMNVVYGRPGLCFFIDGNHDFLTDAMQSTVTSAGFLQGLAASGVDYIVYHPSYLQYVVDMGVADARSLERYAAVEQAWHDRLIFQDESIRVYRTH